MSDALRRAAVAGVATAEDADSIALRVQAALGLGGDTLLECIAFEETCLSAVVDGAEIPVLCSIGPLDHVDRLAPGQVLKFALKGLTIIFGENGSGKSGYARAARRLCTSRVPITLQGNVFTPSGVAPTVTFTVRNGEGEPIPHQWVEGSALPDVCTHMTFLDTANARAYLEDKTEILFLPPEVRCLTILGQLYVLAAERCQIAANQLAIAHGVSLGAQFGPNTSVGQLVALLTTETPLARLPAVERLRAAAVWDDTAANQLADVRLRLAKGPAAQARILRRLGEPAKLLADKAVAVMASLGRQQIDRDSELVQRSAEARAAAETFASEQAGRFPIAGTGSETWKQLFLLARKFAAEADVVPDNGAFEIGDPCLLCQRPLDEDARDRMVAFDAYIAGEAAAAVEVTKREIDARIASLKGLNIDTEEHVLQALAEHRSHDEALCAIVDDAAQTLRALLEHRQHLVAHLAGGPAVVTLPNMAPIVALSQAAQDLVLRAEILERDGGADPAAVALEQELRDREALAGCIDIIVARRDGLADRQRYLGCVTALSTRPISLLASSLRGELVTPELRSRIEREISALGLDHVPLRFTEQSASGKSFFEVALDSAGRAKKSTVLSEGEQRALAIACFLADAHVSQSKGAIIVDDPVTSLDHQRIRRVANRFVAEAACGRQVIIFTHNLLFYQEVIRACADRDPQVPALPCMIQQSGAGFGFVSVNDQPWIAKKVRERERSLEAQLSAMPDSVAADGEKSRILAKQFYTDLRETWERAVEEIVLGGVVERFGTDVKTQSLKMVDVDDADYRKIFFAMKRASGRSGHDQPAAKQLDTPDKKQMNSDLLELRGFIATHKKKSLAASERRKEMEQPPKASIA
ncbi:AAA family ATPase [Sphingomonas sp. BIUV-7]|uniref:AAA family ATPase n=1 Tax=Sphingomonas natans TaxID=3063330 RepID=A0ABT8YAZ7_9SPHN|nr:AAA family ATPase [Sphingomonas sp. BIUV-7]MDO6415490.1 AAA family ATPase [Sphingomonas sp. BIUV-7]